MAHKGGTHNIIIVLRWVVLALGLAATALSTGCGGGGGGSVVVGPHQEIGANLLYVATADAGGTIVQSRVSGASSTPLTPRTVSTGSAPGAVVVDGRFAYALDKSTNSVFQYAVASGGTLSPLSPISVNLGASGSPTALAQDPSGGFIYAADGASIDVLTVSPTGTLAVTAKTIVDGTSMDLAVSGGFVLDTVFNTSGNSLVVYRIGSDGTLTRASTTALGGVSVWDALAVDPSARVACVLREGYGTGAGSIAVYALSGGSPSPIGSPISGGNPTAGAVDAAGNVLYAVDGAMVRAFSIGASSITEAAPMNLPISTPNLFEIPVSPPSTSSPASTRVLLDPAGAYLYIAGASSTVFAIPVQPGAGFAGTPVGMLSTANPASGAAIARAVS